jgi:hypothetical protein
MIRMTINFISIHKYPLLGIQNTRRGTQLCTTTDLAPSWNSQPFRPPLLLGQRRGPSWSARSCCAKPVWGRHRRGLRFISAPMNALKPWSSHPLWNVFSALR